MVRTASIIALFAASCMTTHLSAHVAGPTPTGPGLAPGDAVDLLMSGNERFVTGETEHRHTDPARLELAATEGQRPFATILTCADSRIPVERVFDRGVGDLFVVRVAGNIAGVNEIGSMEYGVEHLGTPVLVVMGHTGCAAVEAVVDGVQSTPSINAMLASVEPAVESAKSEVATQDDRAGIISLAVRHNVFNSIEAVLETSTAISSAVNEGQVRIVGAVYDLATGDIEWIGEHPEQSAIIVQALKDDAEPGSKAQVPTNQAEQTSPTRPVRPGRPARSYSSHGGG